MTEEKELLQKVAETVLARSVSIDVDVVPVNWLHKQLQLKKVLPVKKTFSLKPIYLGTLIRISELLLGVDFDRVKEMTSMDAITHLAQKELHIMAECIALAIHNKKTKVPKRLVKFVLNNFTALEMYKVTLIVIKQIDTQNFISSIILLRGTNILEKTTAGVTSAKS